MPAYFSFITLPTFLLPTVENVVETFEAVDTEIIDKVITLFIEN